MKNNYRTWNGSWKNISGLEINLVLFGEIFLEVLRKYREDKLASLDIHGIFPLWKRDSRELARSLNRLGFKAITTCVDTQSLGKQVVGRQIDEQFLSELAAAVDPCGENGEYHSFIYAGPTFKESVVFTPGEVVLRENRFFYCDLIHA